MDEKVEEIRARLERGKKKRKKPLYHNLVERKRRLQKKGGAHTKAYRELVRQMRSMPAVEVNDPNFIRVKYLRYADDVRHLTRYEILLAEKGGSEERDLRVISPTWRRKPKGKGACEKSRKRVKTLKRCFARPA